MIVPICECGYAVWNTRYRRKCPRCGLFESNRARKVRARLAAAADDIALLRRVAPLVIHERRLRSTPCEFAILKSMGEIQDIHRAAQKGVMRRYWGSAAVAGSVPAPGQARLPVEGRA